MYLPDHFGMAACRIVPTESPALRLVRGEDALFSLLCRKLELAGLSSVSVISVLDVFPDGPTFGSRAFLLHVPSVYRNRAPPRLFAFAQSLGLPKLEVFYDPRLLPGEVSTPPPAIVSFHLLFPGVTSPRILVELWRSHALKVEQTHGIFVEATFGVQPRRERTEEEGTLLASFACGVFNPYLYPGMVSAVRWNRCLIEVVESLRQDIAVLPLRLQDVYCMAVAKASSA